MEEPEINSDYKRAYKFPFLASEILSLEYPTIQEYIFNNNSEKYPVIINLIKQFENYSNKNEIISTLPGYLEKIILSSIKQNPNLMFYICKNYFSIILESLMNNINLDYAREIFFQILNINLTNNNNNLQSDLEIKIQIISEIFNNIKINSTLEKQNDINLEKIKNSITLLIKFIKHMFILNISETEILIKEITLNKNLSILENLIYEKLDSKMSDENVKLEEYDIVKIKSISLFYFNLIETLLLPPSKFDVKDITTSNLFNEEIILLNDNKNNLNFSNQNEAENITEKFDINTHINDVIPNLFNTLSDSFRNNLAEYFIQNFQNLFEIANKVKLYYKVNKQYHSISNTVIVPVSENYLIFLDIFIQLLNLKNKNFIEIFNNSISIFHTLVDDAVFYLHNGFLLNKVLKIYEIILFDDFYSDFKLNLFKQEGKLFKKIAANIDFKNFINLENMTISHRNYLSMNYSHLMRLLNYFYVSMKIINSNVDINLENNSQNNVDYLDLNLFFNVSNEEMTIFENYLSVYLDITSKDLLADKIQSQTELKNTGDEEFKITEKNCNLFLYFIF